MVLNTTNRSTQIAAVNVRATIESALEAIKQFINDNRNTETVLIRKIKQNLGLIDRAINVFREDQKKILDRTIEYWRGNLEQVDDILLIGIRI